MDRRLAAILAADVVGYTRLMERDEAGTIEALRERRRTVLDPLVAQHKGRIVKLMGDGVLVEFASAVNAVDCAVALQTQMAAANEGLADDLHIVLRVGINLGDVVVEGGDLLGDGVNIAARLEGIAEPGGILVSGTAYDHVRNKVKAGFDDLGAQSLKNIEEPLRVYRVAGTPRVTVASRPVTTDKPSIAVLPFANMSDDPAQQYFSDGITEDLITELSRFRSLFVIARNSSFQYRDKAVDVQRMAGELGVRYVVEGSVRKAGNRVRVTAQLVEADTGNHIWAERYDRELEDIFAVQDEVTRTIVATLAGRLEDAGRKRALRKSTLTLSAYDLLLRGKHCLEKGAKDDVLEAREMFKRAIELDPDHARGYVELAETYFYEAISNWAVAPDEAAERLFELGRKAAQLDDQDSRAHLCLAWGYWRVKSNLEMAVTQIEAAITLNPNDLDNYCLKALLCTCAGNLEEGISCTSEAIRRAPNMPEKCLYSRVIAEYLSGRFDQAITSFGRMLQPPVDLYGWIAACYAQLGRDTAAHAAAAEFRDRVRAENLGPPGEGSSTFQVDLRMSGSGAASR